MRRCSSAGSIAILSLALAGLGCGEERGGGGGETSGGTAPPDEPRAPAGPPTSPGSFSEEGADAPVTLRFEWPDGARGRVESSRVMERQGLGTTGRATAHYRLSIERRGERTTVRTRELVIRAPEGGPGEALAGVLVAATFIPSARWSTDVEALTLIEPERTAETLSAAIRPVATAEVRALPGWPSVAPIVSGDPEMLRRQASSLLSPLTTLDGLEVASQAVPARTRDHTPDGLAAERSTHTRLLGMGPCFDGDAQRCATVEVVASYTADPSVTEPGPSGGAILSMQGRLRLLVEPRTLLPHRMEAEKTTRFLATVDGAAVDTTEIETLRWSFSYSPESIR